MYLNAEKPGSDKNNGCSIKYYLSINHYATHTNFSFSYLFKAPAKIKIKIYLKIYLRCCNKK